MKHKKNTFLGILSRVYSTSFSRVTVLAVCILFYSFILSTIFAQEETKSNTKIKQISNVQNINSTQATGDKVKIKDEEGNILMGVQDEGTFGSIWLPDSTGAPATTTNKIYNVNGNLHFNGNALSTAGSGAGGWIDDGTIVRLSTITDKVGIGTTSPITSLHVDGTEGVLFGGNVGTGTAANLGLGTRFMWYPKKSALRAGSVDAAQWDDANIGDYSTAFGVNTVASGLRSTALGYITTANGDHSTSLGAQTTASGNYSTTLGYNTLAESFLSTVIGRYNVGGGTADSWVAEDPLFEIGNGTDASNKNNAMIVLKNGNIGIGANNPNVKLSVNGTIRMSGMKMANGATNGHVLTTDGNGNGTWQASPSGVTKIDDLSDANYDGSSLFIGNNSGLNDDGTLNSNTAVGNNALQSNTAGFSNTAVGANALQSNTTGDLNTVNGYSVLYSNTDGNRNTAIGSSALYSNTLGNNNVSIGYYSNYYNQGGSNNTIIGYQAGHGSGIHDKSGNVFIGYQAGFNETGSNKLYIENSSSNWPLIWGDFEGNSPRLVINGNGSSGTGFTFWVEGASGGNSSWNNTSDRRLKKNITTISNALEKVKKMRGVNYKWKDEDKFSKGLQMGFIAQEANKIIPEVVDDSGEFYSMQYAPITALLVEAVKEQDIKIQNLKKENEKIRIQNAELNTALLKNKSLAKEVELLKAALHQIITKQNKIELTSK